MIDLTLNSIMVPDITGYTPPFGTKVERNQINKGGLSSKQVNANVLLPFIKMRGVPVSVSGSTTQVEYNAALLINSASVTLTLGDPAYDGCILTIACQFASGTALLIANGSSYTLRPKQVTRLVSQLGKWTGADCPVGFTYVQFKSQDTPAALYPCTAWSNVSSSYAGRFFRAEGGAAAAFGSDQAEGLPNITGSIGCEIASSSDVRATGAFYSGGPYSFGADGQISNESFIYQFNAARSSSIYGVSTHVTPVNSTIRIWKRTA